MDPRDGFGDHLKRAMKLGGDDPRAEDRSTMGPEGRDQGSTHMFVQEEREKLDRESERGEQRVGSFRESRGRYREDCQWGPRLLGHFEEKDG